ncbi:Phosphotransferase enzyme family [Rhizoctonia solani]|uniref:Phosphotransferase enzyme family n=1 Tax=Rhizoctonia solani TaxID=456999 RepID=A0A8H7IEU5_9AGAM|nr:Phosphotransferase enzyme family [Rhizoctonia solani]
MTTSYDLRTAKGVLAYLNTTPFPATDATLLTGGNSAYTFRATLKTPLASGDKTIVLKHAETQVSATFYDPGLKTSEVSAQRNEFEYKMLSVITESELCDSYDLHGRPRLTDPLQTILQEGFDAGTLDYRQLSHDIGSALGDFLGRLHTWTSAPEQAPLRALISQNDVAKRCLSIQHAFAHETLDKLGLKEQWIEDALSRDLEESAAAEDTLIWGDSWPVGNILVTLPSETQPLRIHLTDWEMSRLGPPEFDLGEAVGVAMSVVHQRYPQGDHPYIQSLHSSYRKHRALNPVRAARSTGVAIIGHSFIMPWVVGQDEQSQRSLASAGIALIKVAQSEEIEEIKKHSLLKELF